MKIITNKKLDRMANQIIELQKTINNEANTIEINNYIKIVDLLSDIAKECLDLPAFIYVCKTLNGEQK